MESDIYPYIEPACSRSKQHFDNPFNEKREFLRETLSLQSSIVGHSPVQSLSKIQPRAKNPAKSSKFPVPDSNNPRKSTITTKLFTILCLSSERELSQTLIIAKTQYQNIEAIEVVEDLGAVRARALGPTTGAEAV